MTSKIPGILVLILATLLAVQPVTPQSNRIEARMIDKEKGSVKKVKVLLSYDDVELSIQRKTRSSVVNTIPFSAITHASYTYSERVQIAEGIGAAAFTLTTGYLVPAVAIGSMFFTSKKKTHWLGIQTPKGSHVFELGKNDYRQILLDLKALDVNIEDLGRSTSQSATR